MSTPKKATAFTGLKRSEAHFSGVGKLNIFRQSWVPPEARSVVVIAHGVGEHSGRYAHVAKRLVASGCAVYALDHRGHGRSDGQPRAYVDRMLNTVNDLDQLVSFAQTEQRVGKLKLPLFLLGHSMGGAISLRYACTHQDKLDGLILSGPAVALDGTPPLVKPISKLLSAVVPRLGTFGIDPSAVTRDPAMVAGYASDPLNCHGKLPARTLGEIVRLVEWLPAALPALTLPLLIMHGAADSLAGPAGSRMVMERVGSTDKTFKLYPELYHEIFNELPADRKRVLDDLCAWIEHHGVRSRAPAGGKTKTGSKTSVSAHAPKVTK